MPPNARLVKLNSRIGEAFQKIAAISDESVAGFSEDVSKMARQLLKDKIKHPERSTGELAASVEARKDGERKYAVVTSADNADGYGYGAAQNWGWKRPKGKKAGKKVKGKQFIIRATFGMIARWKRGERWRD